MDKHNFVTIADLTREKIASQQRIAQRQSRCHLVF